MTRMIRFEFKLLAAVLTVVLFGLGLHRLDVITTPEFLRGAFVVVALAVAALLWATYTSDDEDEEEPVEDVQFSELEEGDD